MNIIIGILITAISYLIYPFLKFKIICKKKYYSLERIRCELIMNSIVICIVYLILQQVLTGNISIVNFTPALVYYYINVGLHKNRNEKFDKKTNKNVEEKKDSELLVESKKEKPKIKNEESLQINDTSMTQDNIIKDNTQQSHEKKIKNNTLVKILPVILGIFLLISIIVIFSLLIKNEKQRLKIIDLEEKYSNYDDLTKYKDLYFDEMAKNVKLSNKASFMDEHIVFVLDGYGNYYYSYDCMKQVTQGKQYTFWAYNISQAIGKGYQKFECNKSSVRERLGITE